MVRRFGLRRDWSYTAVVVALGFSAGCERPAAPTKVASTGISEADALAAAKEASESAVPLDSEGYRPLRLRDFEPFPADATTWSEADGLLKTTGKPKGYLSSKRSYRNFTWRADFRFVPDADVQKHPDSNTGFMLCIQEPHKVWPRSLEVQGKFIEMGQIKSNGGVPALTINDDQASREKARKPVGEWNEIEITCKDGTVSSMLNGQAICISEPGELLEGKIGVQAENFPVEFRKLRIRED